MQLEHNSQEDIYRFPFGACTAESRVTLRLLVTSQFICERVICVVNNIEIPMRFAFETGVGRMYECNIELPSTPCLVHYYFYASCCGETVYFGNNESCLGGLGKEYSHVPDKLFQITVYDKSFTTPDWMKNAVVYQIFPDRFHRSGNTPFHGIERKWKEEPFYLPEQFGGKFLANDFFGGNFEGIRKKLPYLADLGITAVYLNPISKAFSNHRYDTGDYEIPDELLGTVEDFRALCAESEKYGIKIILDGVFSHTGADSRYFNKYKNYDSVGAYQSENSPFFSWYSFKNFPNDYDCWWGFDTLPNVNELDEDFISYIAENKNSVIRKWLRRGASGFRLDVADELPDEFIGRLRASLKEENPDSLLIGEVWEDASCKVSYGKRRKFLLGHELDSVMNYVFSEAVISYLTTQNAGDFSMKINSLLENYPMPALYCAMNLLSSHDIPRVLTRLGGAPDFRTLSREQQHNFSLSGEALFLAERRMVLATVLQMTMVGAPTIYYGDEIGMQGYADPFNRAPMDWEKDGGIIYEQTRLLANLRKQNQCLRCGFFKILYYTESIVAYMRYSENGRDAFGKLCTDDSVIVLVNSSQKEETITLCLDRFFVSSLRDTLSGEHIEYEHTLTLSLKPLSYRLLTPERKDIQCIKIQSTQ